ncbi:MAG: S8 family peptidase [Bacteroidia bacterium]|nr:S8 family peptidase [Bacteroidia bacterium]
MKYLTTFFCILFSMIFSLSGQNSGKIAPSVWEELLKNGESEVFIILKQKADLSSAGTIKGKDAKGAFVAEALQTTARISQQSIKEWLSSQNVSFTSFWIVNAIQIKGDFSLIQTLANRPDVAQIIRNGKLSYHVPVERQTASGKTTAAEWGITQIQADQVWAMGIKGANVVVGGQDTGYDWEHPAIKSQYRGWNGTSANHNYNWHDAIHVPNPANPDTINPCGYSIHFPCDDQEHGTHTMGTMVGEDGAEQIGVAPEAQWIGVRNMERGWGMLSTYIEAFEWFIAPTDTNNLNPDPSKAPHVINNSWGCPESEGCDPSNFATMEAVINNVKSAGIVTVASAGNNGSSCNTVNSPAAIFQNSFSVGATDFFDNATGFSSRGDVTVDGSNRRKPDVVAPGLFVRSCVPGGGYASLSGTSMAGPHVAGAVALLISAKPSLAGEVDSIIYFLQTTAKPLTTDEACGGDSNTDVPNNTFGYGRIDIFEAVKAALGNSVAIDPEMNSVGVRIFPSPAHGQLNIEFEKPLTVAADVSVFQADGRRVLQQVLSTKTVVNLSGLSAGLYFCKINAGSQVYSQTIWIE